MKKYTDTGKKDTRSGFGAGLAELRHSKRKTLPAFSKWELLKPI